MCRSVYILNPFICGSVYALVQRALSVQQLRFARDSYSSEEDLARLVDFVFSPVDCELDHTSSWTGQVSIIWSRSVCTLEPL